MCSRCELPDVKTASKRLVQVFDFLLEIYGQYALERKIKLSDFTEENIWI
jgi:hypothetical protein